ncbi:hypothetical protein FAMCQIZV_CDS0033 [Phage C72C1]|nr:hypothetical protein FAMCQIZV_CDS0033 [Phage C72C1]
MIRNKGQISVQYATIFRPRYYVTAKSLKYNETQIT